MRIAGFHVEGFGALSDFGIDDLSPGLVIFNGPNEAGKSTMLDFLTTMLFGFPSRRDNPRFRPPVRGGRHGGQLTLSAAADETGPDELWSIGRYATPRKELVIRRPDGRSASEDELRRALGGADETLFRAVFAIDLSELGSADAMTKDEVRELLFSASIVGQRRSAAHAMANLQRRRSELARLRQGDARANSLMAELDDTRRALSEARRDATGYPAQLAELTRLEVALDQAREETERTEHRMRELDLLMRLWDVLERRRAAEERLASWQEPTASAALLETEASELQSLRADCSGHLERLNQRAELCNQRAGIDQSIESALDALGRTWDRQGISAGAGWIGLTDEARQFRASLAERQARWREARALAEDAEASLELTGPQGGAEGAETSLTAAKPDPEDQARLVAELRRNLAEQRRLLAERLAAERDGTAPGVRLLGHRTAISMALIGLAMACLGAVAAVVTASVTVRVLCFGLAAGGLALFLLATASRRGSTSAPVARPELEKPYDRTVTRIGELASSLGLPNDPTESDIETTAEQVELARTRERVLSDERRRRSEALGRLKTAQESLERARDELECEQARFEDWKQAHGLVAAHSPDGVLESLTVLQATHKNLAALDRVDKKVHEQDAVIEEFEARLTKLARRYCDLGGRLESQGSDPTRTLEELNAVLEGVLELRSVRSSLLEVLDSTGFELERSLGRGHDARRLRGELESGQVLAWGEEQEVLARARVDSLRSLEVLLRAHQDASNDLRALASSAEIARLEQKRLTLEHDLEEVLRSWALLGCSRLLLERTLRRHEQERQPAVLARAAERFAKVTEGRYTSVLPSIGDDATREAIRVVSSSGAELDASALSRGSIEQLYLCLRIGLAENFAERSESLPLILDDVLVNFDPARASSVAELLAETAEHQQVLFLTCHPHLTDLVRHVAPQAQVVELERL